MLSVCLIGCTCLLNLQIDGDPTDVYDVLIDPSELSRWQLLPSPPAAAAMSQQVLLPQPLL
jgi:hypothetical protein